MLKAPIPTIEDERIQTLKEYKILDTEQEAHFDEITKTASVICNCKIALISLIDSERQWFKSKYGIDANQTSRDVSFCGHAIMGDEVFVIEDAQKDLRFCDNPLFLNKPHVRFYAGAPLIAPNGQRIGTLCVIDSEVKSFSDDKKLLLKTLAKQVINYLELRKKNETQLELIGHIKTSEKKLNQVFKNMLEGMVVQDKSGKIIEFNAAALEILGLTENQLLGKDSMDPDWKSIKPDGSHFPGEEHPAMITLTTGKTISNVVMGLKQNKKGTRWIRINSAPFFTEDGINSVTTFQDITYEEELKKEILEKNAYLDFAMEGAQLGIWDWNLETNKVNFDRRWLEMLGLNINDTPMELSTWETRVHPDDLKKCFEDIQAYTQGKTDHYENIHRMKHANGHWVYILDRGRIAERDENGKPIRFTGTHLDITETKRNQEKRLAEITDILASTPSCLKVVDKNGKLLEMNQQGLELIEADCFDAVSGNDVFQLVNELFREDFIKFNQRICNGSRGSMIFEITGLKGTKRWLESYSAPYKLPNGDFAHIAITNDITSKINQEIELKKQKAYAQHSAKLASIGEMAAGIGHEINNPLAIIKGYLSTLNSIIEDKGGIELNSLKKYLNKIDIAGDRIARIVQGLRTYSRSDSSENALFNPTTVIEESVEMIKELYSREEIKISCKSMSGNRNYTINGISGKFQQIIINLINNARDAVAFSKKKEIEIISEIKQGKFIISIHDTGCGIPENIFDKIFDPFFTTKDVNRGTGIGLYLVYNFIKEMNGEITVNSIENQSTTFTIQVPAIESPERLANDLQNDNSLMHLNLNALIVDDEEEICETLSTMLKKIGVPPTVASNGKIALDLFLEQPEKFDLIISDMKMPVLDGPSLLEAIRGMKDIKQPQFIFISGGIDFTNQHQSLEINLGANGYLSKPFDIVMVKDTICASLNTKAGEKG